MIEEGKFNAASKTYQDSDEATHRIGGTPKADELMTSVTGVANYFKQIDYSKYPEPPPDAYALRDGTPRLGQHAARQPLL